MKQSKYLITGDDISEMGLSLLPGKEHLSGKKTLTKLEIISTYYATVSGIDDDDRCVTYERVTPSVYLEINKTALSFLASGGTDTITLDTNLSSDQISVNHSSSRFSVTKNSNNTITVKANNLGTTVYSQVNDTLTISGGGITRTCSLSQEANEIESYDYTYGVDAYIGEGINYVPASGGYLTIRSTTHTYKTPLYTSGSTGSTIDQQGSTADVSVTPGGWSLNSSTTPCQVSTSSWGTTVGQIYNGEVTVSFNGAEDTLNIYQEANTIVDSKYNYRITTYGTPTVSIGEGLTAAGGSAKVTYSVYNTYTYNVLYASGSIGPNKTEKALGSVTLSLTTNGNNRFNLSGSTISHNSMGTNLTTDTVTVKATNSDSSLYYSTDSVSIENTRQIQNVSGGITTYGDVMAGTLVNSTILASGGSATATAGNGSQSWTKSAEITTYLYDSGSTKEETTSAATSGTNSITPNITSISGSASSKGTTISGQTIVKSQTITWTGNKNNSGSTNISTVSGTIYIYQKANQIEEKFLDLPDFNTTVNLEWSPDMVNMQSYLGNVYKKESYTSDAISAGTLIGIAGTHPAIVEDPTIINQDSGMNIRPSAYMLIIDDNTSNTQRTAVLEWEITDTTGEYDSFIKRMTIIQEGKPISVGYGSLALTTAAGMFPPYISNYKIEFRNYNTSTLLESCVGSPSILTGQIPILQDITDSVVDKSSLLGVYQAVKVSLSNADTGGGGSLSPTLYTGTLSTTDIQNLKNGIDKTLIVS